MALLALSTGGVSLVKAASVRPADAFSVGSQPNAAALDADGSQAAVGTVVGSVGVWRLQGGAKISGIEAGDEVDAVGFGMHGRWLAVGTADGRARVFDVASGRPITEATLHSGPVRQLLISRDDRYLVTATRDGVVSLWPLSDRDDPEWIAGVARRVMRDQPAGPLFVPNAALLPAPDPARLRRLVETLRRCASEPLRREGEMLDAYLGP